MANPWFRFYSEFSDDPKVQMLSESLQRRLVMLFCLRCKEQLETLHETEIAFHLRLTPDQLVETKAIFIEKGFIDEDWNIVNWNRRQFISDSSTERVRRHRQALKQSETFHVTPCNGSVTVQNRTEQIKTEQSPAVPAWVSSDSWDGFVEMRKKMRKPLTDRAKKSVIKILEGMHSKGEDANASLETATMKNWLIPYAPDNGLFAKPNPLAGRKYANEGQQ